MFKNTMNNATVNNNTKEEKKIKWQVLRLAFIAALTVAYVGTFAVKKHYHYPVEWLLHYLNGSGKAKEVPPHLFQRASSALAAAIRDNTYDYDVYGSKAKYCVHHSTLYEGSGFADRPSLFYLIGGFTFMLIKPKWLYKHEGCFLVSGHDVYDWHVNDQGFYFDSPLGDSAIMRAIVNLLGLIYGREYFHISDKGDACLSNKLWETFSQYGAKEFTSYWENVVVDLSDYQDWIYPDDYCDDYYDEYEDDYDYDDDYES